MLFIVLSSLWRKAHLAKLITKGPFELQFWSIINFYTLFFVISFLQAGLCKRTVCVLDFLHFFLVKEEKEPSDMMV